MEEKMLTLEKFEEASEIVKRVTLETKLVFSDYFTAVECSQYALVISLSRGFVLIAGSLWVLSSLFGGSGIWWAPACSEALTLMETAVRVLRCRRRRLEPRASG